MEGWSRSTGRSNLVILPSHLISNLSFTRREKKKNKEEKGKEEKRKEREEENSRERENSRENEREVTAAPVTRSLVLAEPSSRNLNTT